jgi:hypothetical protein
MLKDIWVGCRIWQSSRVIVVRGDSRPRERLENSMKYFLLLAGDGELGVFDELSEEEQGAQMVAHGAFAEACGSRAEVELLGGEALGSGSTATTLRTVGGEMTITDGPFAEVAEHIGGYYLLEAPDLDTVIELCKILPGYDIDIRPVLDMS